MLRQVLGTSLLALLVSGCSASNGAPAAAARGGSEPPPSGVLAGNPRYFQLLPDDTFWVTHEASGDRVVSSGARLELTLRGEVTASAWETERAHNGDQLTGGLALSQQLGGGYLFWTQSRLFRSTEFTGPLVPVSLGVTDAADTQIRGARSGLRGAVIATDTGVRELLPGAAAATPFPYAGVTDLAALDASRAIRIDAFGRTGWTIDGGKSWTEAPGLSSLGLRGLVAAQDEVWFETWQGRAVLGKQGGLTDPEGQGYRYNDYSRPFQLAYRGTRADRDDGYFWGYREAQPLQAAVMSGVRFPDGSALGAVRGGVTRVDLATGKILSLATDWLPNGVECQPHQVGESVLFACAWDDYQGGSYLLRADGLEPPHVERFFSDDGAFVADDDGAFGYTGKCKAEPRFVDPERYYGRYGHNYYDGEGQEPSVQPVFCVRRGPEDWVERKIELDQDTSLVAWIPRKDGTAVALVRGTGRGEALPDLALGSQRDTSQNGVRVVRIYRDVEGWFWPGQQVRSYYSRGANQQTIIDRRYRALDDGTIVAWLTDSESSYGQPPKSTGATLRPGGRTEVFELPATPLTMATGGPFGLLTTREGKVFESTDRGRTWREAGTTPLVPATMTGTCSALGCSFATGARVGWGGKSIAPRVVNDKREEAQVPKANLPVVTCEPQGAPRAEQSNTSPAAAQLGSQAKITITTGFGATLEMIRETPDALSQASPYGYPRYVPPPPVPTATPSAAPSASAKAKASSAPVRTHTLVMRPPLDPLAPIVRHNATNAAISGYRSRASAVPLLGANSEVSFLFIADQNEVLVDRTDLVTVPSYDTRRYYYYGDNSGSAPGLRTASNRALVFGDFRRRSSLEEHGALPQRPPYYFGFDRDANRRRTLALGRLDDGAVGVLVLDAAAPETVGLAPYDRVSSTFGALGKLASWSTVVTADDAACKADRKGYRALVIIDPSAWLALDSAKLPGVALGKQGLALIRWSEERVCLEAIDVAVTDARRRGDASAGENLVIRWGGGPASKAPSKDGPAGEAVGALRSLELMQPLVCSMMGLRDAQARPAPQTPDSMQRPK